MGHLQFLKSRARVQGGIRYDADNYNLLSSEGSAELIQTSKNEFKLLADDKLLTIARTDVGGFVLTNRDGTKSWFGTASESRLYNVQDPSKTFSWSIDRIRDKTAMRLPSLIIIRAGYLTLNL